MLRFDAAAGVDAPEQLIEPEREIAILHQQLEAVTPSAGGLIRA